MHSARCFVQPGRGPRNRAKTPGRWSIIEARMPTDDDKRGPAFAWTVWTLIIIAGVALALMRVMAVNLPWHLATARLAQETGHWPAVNTFSYTFPDYPVYQQYPAFQATMWAIFRVAGWDGLSAATAVGWMAGVPAGRALGGAAPPGRALPRAVDAGAVGAAAADGVAARHVHDDRVRRRAAGAGRVRARPDARAGAGAAGAPACGSTAISCGRCRWSSRGCSSPISPGSATGAARAWRRWRSAASVLLTFATPLGFRHRAGAAAHGAVAGDLPRRTSTSSTASGRCRTSSTLALATGRARRVGAVAHAPDDAAVRSGALAAVAGAGDIGGARADVLRRRQRRRLPALRAARARRGRDAAAAARRDHAPRSRASPAWRSRCSRPARRGLLPLGEPAAVAGRNAARLRAARSAAGRRRRPTSCAARRRPAG